MPAIERQVSLGFTEGTSDKVYIITLWSFDDGTYSTVCEYGKRGSSLKTTTKAYNTSLAQAEFEFAKVLAQKTGKGYKVESSVHSPAEVTTKEVADALRKIVEPEPEVSKTDSLTCSDDARKKALERLRKASACA